MNPKHTGEIDAVEFDRRLAPETRLSRLLFDAQESAEILADVAEARTGRPDAYTRNLVARIAAYRAEQGWSPNGYGGEAQQSGRSGDDQ